MQFNFQVLSPQLSNNEVTMTVKYFNSFQVFSKYKKYIKLSSIQQNRSCSILFEQQHSPNFRSWLLFIWGVKAKWFCTFTVKIRFEQNHSYVKNFFLARIKDNGGSEPHHPSLFCQPLPYPFVCRTNEFMKEDQCWGSCMSERRCDEYDSIPAHEQHWDMPFGLLMHLLEVFFIQLDRSDRLLNLRENHI